MKLQTFLIRNKLSLRDFAINSGLSAATIHNILELKTVPRVETCYRIEKATKGRVTMHDLVKKKRKS